MKVISIIKKANIIFSLWLIAVMAVLLIFGSQLNINGFYFASLVLAGMILASNSAVLMLGIVNGSRAQKEAKRQYKNY